MNGIKKEDISREDFETAVLRNHLEIIGILRDIVEFQEKLGEAIEMLAKEQGYEFTLKEDARA